MEARVHLMTPQGTSEKLTVAITGAGGYVASRLIEGLGARKDVGRILGFDLRPPLSALLPPNFIFDSIDVRSPALEARLEGVDVVIHLAFVMDPIKDESEMRDVNVNGSQNVFRSAGKAGVKKVIYTSSATAYGAHPDNDMPLTEDSPLRANLDFSYPAHKLEVEYVVKEFRSDFPDATVTVFRPAIVFGPHVDNAWSHMLELPFAVCVGGYSPPMQFVHEDDVAEALLFAVSKDLDGAFNLAAPGHLTFDQMLSILGKRRLDLPEAVAFGFSEKLWGLGLAEAPAGMLHYLMHPWILSTEKLERQGFVPRHSNEDAFRAAADQARGKVRLGRNRVETKRLLQGAAGAAGVAGAALAWRGVRRRAS